MPAHRQMPQQTENGYRTVAFQRKASMLIGLGMELVEIDRIRHSLERFGRHFLDKLLHSSERASLFGSPDLTAPNVVAHIAGRFAAKEAASKALGSGLAEGIGLHDIRVASLPSGKPELSFHGNALKRATSLKVEGIHLSLSHTRTSAGAVVVLESHP